MKDLVRETALGLAEEAFKLAAKGNQKNIRDNSSAGMAAKNAAVKKSEIVPSSLTSGTHSPTQLASRLRNKSI